MLIFEFLYANKIKKDIIMEVIDKYIDDYYIHIIHKPNGNIEIFIGNKRKESEE